MSATKVQKISPFLWFDGKAEEAARFYVTLFDNSRVVGVSPMDAVFELEGVEFMALNGGPMYVFTPAVSFFVKCETQDEVDRLWAAFGADGGAPQRCGWVTDRFGLSWQIIPNVLGRYLSDPDRARANRVIQAMMQMTKIVIADLDAAAAG